jgi:outer membrane protein assembly factor BamB
MTRFSAAALTCCFALVSASASDWPQWMGPERNGIWNEPDAGGRMDLAHASMLWEAPVGGGYAGPAVSGDFVYVASRHAAPTSDTSKGLPGHESLRCFQVSDGSPAWEQRWPATYTIDYPSGPRATPTVHDGRVYFLGAEGRFVCCSAESGKILWQHELRTSPGCAPPIWGFASHPLIFENLVIIVAGGDGSTCMAYDRITGAEKWRALSSKQAGYCPPTLITAHGKPTLIVWHGEAINALNPATGATLWSQPRETRYGVSMANPVAHGNHLLISAFWWGSRMLSLPAEGEPSILWETQRESDTRTEHLNALMCTPILAGDHLYGVCSYGQLRCLDWKTGARRWETFAATTEKETRWGNAFLTRLGSNSSGFLIANERGELIHAALTPDRYREIARRQLIEPNSPDVRERKVVWSHPAYAGNCIFWRNDATLRCWRILKPSE